MNRSTQGSGSDKEQQKYICVGNPEGIPTNCAPEQIILLDGSVPVLDELSEPNVEGVWITRDQFPRVSELRGLAQSGAMLRDMSEGIALIDFDNRVLWANRRLLEWVDQDENSAVGMGFYDLLGNPKIMGPDFSPFHTTMATGEESHSTLHAADNRYFQVNASTIEHPDQFPHSIAALNFRWHALKVESQ